MRGFLNTWLPTHIVQDAPQWTTLVSLVAAGLGVSLAPACIARVAIPGAVSREIQAACRTTIDLGVRQGNDKPLVRNFVRIARARLAARKIRSLQ